MSGDNGKREGMDRALRAANPDWRAWMYERIVETARRKPFFTTDELEQMRTERQGPRTHEHRALGPLMRQAARDGICTPTEDWIESRMRDNHSRPKRVWYSLIYRGRAVAKPKPRKLNDPRQYTLLEE